MFDLTGIQNSGFRPITQPSLLEELQRKAETFPRGRASLTDVTNLFTCSTNAGVNMDSIKKMMDQLYYRTKDYMASIPNDVFKMGSALNNVPQVEKIAYFLEKENMTCEEIIGYYTLKMI